jgi:hypothetical protein
MLIHMFIIRNAFSCCVIVRCVMRCRLLGVNVSLNELRYSFVYETYNSLSIIDRTILPHIIKAMIRSINFKRFLFLPSVVWFSEF